MKKKSQYNMTEKEYSDKLQELRSLHKKWKEFNKQKNIGFFQIFNKDFSEKIPQLSGNSIKLFVYLGTFADSYTGELTVSVDKMQKDLNCTKRSIQNWLKELTDHNLIMRVQLGYKSKTHTFLLPYNQEFLELSKPFYTVTEEILNRE